MSLLRVPERKQHAEDEEGHPQDDEERETQLQMEYDRLTEILSILRRRFEELRKENEFLQNEANQTHMENQEYISYLSKTAEKRQNTIVALSDQNRQEMEELRRQKQNMLDRHKKQTNELKREILQKENELALLNINISDLIEFKTLREQQVSRIAELEQEFTAMNCHHSQSLVDLKALCLKEKKDYKKQAKNKLQALTITANKEALLCRMSHSQEVFQENRSLHEDLQQLVQKAQALHKQQGLLQSQRRQLLLEREYVQGLYHQRISTLNTRGRQNTQHPQSSYQ